MAIKIIYRVVQYLNSIGREKLSFERCKKLQTSNNLSRSEANIHRDAGKHGGWGLAWQSNDHTGVTLGIDGIYWQLVF